MRWAEAGARVTCAVAAARGWARGVWARDRTGMRGGAAAWNRLLRIAIWTVRGLFVHRLSVQAAALTYYTVFSIVPVLVVVLWLLKALHVLPLLIPASPKLSAALPGTTAAPSEPVLRSALRTILSAVQRAGSIDSGLAGLVALSYGAFKMFRRIEDAIDDIASARERAPVYRRLLGFLALLLLPLVLLLMAAIIAGLSRAADGSAFGDLLARLLNALPMLRSAAGVAVGVAIFGLALAIFYASAARARLTFKSAAVGGLCAAAALVVTTWAFTRFQIGVARASVIASGVAALPVFMLWAFACWYVVLVGAEIAVAHDLDRALSHGASPSAWTSSPLAEQAAAAGLMIEVARRQAGLTTDELACALRILPATIRALATRLAGAGMLRRSETGRYELACDPETTVLGDVVAAISGRPEEGDAHWALAAVLGAGPAAHAGPTLRELATTR